MPHDISLISTITVGFVFAFILGLLAHRLRLPPLVGYLIAGIFIGPFTPGYVADGKLAGQLAEIGVILLMFGVGLHFSIGDLLAVRHIAIPGAFGQILLATGMGVGMAMLWGWTFGAGLVLGLSLSVASTVVLLKALEERNAVESPNGRIAIGWLIVEDLAMVLALVLLPALAEILGGTAVDAGHGGEPGPGLFLSLIITLAKVGAFVALAVIVGPRVMPWILHRVARTGSRELFTLSVLAIALGIAYGSMKFFGVSFALGAFFAGMVLNESDLSHKAASSSMPLQDAFAVLFFVSVGMLFDPSILYREPVKVGLVVLLIVVGKSLVAFGIVVLLRFPYSTALTVSAALAQIGEFSFILAGLGQQYGLLPKEGVSLILAGALLSITLNPLAFSVADRLGKWIQKRKSIADYGAPRFAQLQHEIQVSREKAEAKAATHKTFTPEELVGRFPLFEKLSTEQREVLILHFHPHHAEPGERVIRAGDKAEAVFFIASGKVEVSIGLKRIILNAGDFFGEMGLITGQPRSADVTAVDYCEFLTLSLRDFWQFIRKYPDIRERVEQMAAERERMNRDIQSTPPPPDHDSKIGTATIETDTTKKDA